MSQSRQLAAIMFTDIVGYSALMDEDERKAFELLKKNRQIQRPVIEKYHGRWLKEMGDGVLASFPTVTDAVYCAAAIQKTCEDQPELTLRIGIHQGEVVFDGEDVFGSGVNIASRLEPLAPAGGILVSDSVHRNLGNKTNIVSTFVGEEQLKNVREPVRIYSVQVEGLEPVAPAEPFTAKHQASPMGMNIKTIVSISLAAIVGLVLAYFIYPRQSSESTQLPQPEVINNSIAVLPFKNDSPDPDNQYFADGMMDEILNHLQKIAELGVKSRTAVEPYRNSKLSFGTIAEELDVAFVLEGAVRKYRDRFRVTTQLIEVQSGNHLWSDTYDGVFSDTIFVVQSNIAKKIAASLNTVITPDEEERLDRMPTTEIEAYDLLVRARHELNIYWASLDPRHLETAHSLNTKALMIDPKYMQAIGLKGSILLAEQDYDSALFYAEKAIRLDPTSGGPYMLKGECYFFMRELDLAVESYQEALRIYAHEQSNGSAWANIAMARALNARGDIIEALPYLAKGLELDREDTPGVYLTIAGTFAEIGDYERTRKYSVLGMETSPTCFNLQSYGRVLINLDKLQQAQELLDSYCNQLTCAKQCNGLSFQIALIQGDFEKAEQYFSQWQNTKESEGLNQDAYIDYQIGYVYLQQGREQEAANIFMEEIPKLKSMLDNQYQYAGLSLSRIHAVLGNRQESLKYLAELVKAGHFGVYLDFISIDPFFENLKDDPELISIVNNAQQERAALREQVEQMEARGEFKL